jgi:predicted RNA-binding protein YlxR (DUF448 family)
VSGPSDPQPERVCVGCGQQAPKRDLERFIYHDEAGLVFDLRCKAPGRGTYVHPHLDCLKGAVERGGFSRGFKQRVITDPHEVLDDVRRGIRRRLDEGLRVALTSQSLQLGGPAVSQAFKDDDVGLLLVATDAGESTRRKFISNAERKDAPVNTDLSGEEIARAAGRDFVAVAAVSDSLVAERIGRDLERLEQLAAL